MKINELKQWIKIQWKMYHEHRQPLQTMPSCNIWGKWSIIAICPIDIWLGVCLCVCTDYCLSKWSNSNLIMMLYIQLRPLFGIGIMCILDWYECVCARVHEKQSGSESVHFVVPKFGYVLSKMLIVCSFPVWLHTFNVARRRGCVNSDVCLPYTQCERSKSTNVVLL